MIHFIYGEDLDNFPTLRDTMFKDRATQFKTRLIWECTRFCISPRAETGEAGRIAASLMISSCEMGLQFGASDSVGVFDARMVRIYRRIGWEPTVLGTKGEGRDKTSVGLWELTEDVLELMCKRSQISRETSKAWFNKGFSHEAHTNAA